MNKLKYFIFIFIMFLSFDVFASTTNVSNKVKYSTSSGGGTYNADEIYLGGYNGIFSINTRYNGRVSMISFYLSTSDYNFSTNRTYTIILNMATSDWRNNFMGPQVINAQSNGSLGSALSVSNFRFVSQKQIKFNFKIGSTLYPYLFFRVYSTDYASSNNTAITGVNNWNLSSIYIDNNVSATPTPAPVPTPTPAPNNQQIIDNATQNTNDIIDNATQNTTDIIDNNNSNTQSIIDNQKDLLNNCSRNIIPNYSESLSGRTFNYPLSLESGKSYTISSNAGIAACVHNGNFSCVYEYVFNDYGGGSYSSHYTFTANSNTLYLSLSNGYGYGNYNITYSETMINLGTSVEPFVLYGTEKCINKIDQTNESIINSTNSINTTNTNNTNRIIDSQRQNIINQINQERNQKGNFCSNFIQFNFIGGYHIRYNGQLDEDINYLYTDFVPFPNSSTQYTIMEASDSNIDEYICFYDSNKQLIGTECQYLKNRTGNVPEGTSYFRLSTSNYSTLGVFYGGACENRLDIINGTMKDETQPDIDLDLDLNSNSPVSDLLTMPLTILNKVFDITDDTCVPYELPFDFSGGNNTITFPCIDLEDYLGHDVYTILDTILCFYMCYQIGLMCVSIYEGITSLRDGFYGLYEPKHHDTSTRTGRGEMEGKY